MSKEKSKKKPKKMTSEPKIYVLDTNIFMSDPDCIEKFEDNFVVIPDVVIEELDSHKKDFGDRGYNTRHALNNIERYRVKGNLTDGVPTGSGGTLKVAVRREWEGLLPKTWGSSPDNAIIETAMWIKKQQEEGDHLRVRLVSKDTGVRIKADAMGLQSENYKNERVEDDELLYDGRCELTIPHAAFEAFCSEKHIQVPKKIKLRENEFAVLVDSDTFGTKLAWHRKGELRALASENYSPFGIRPRNAGQKFAIEALLAPAEDVPLVILKGAAGTAKTLLTLACALDQITEENRYRKITVTRANVEFDKDIGALPGSEEAKVGPLLRGCMDNLEILVNGSGQKIRKTKDRDLSCEVDTQSKINYLIDHGWISTEALGFLRGRSLTNQVLYVDEAQNCTQSQMLGILTRPGTGTKVVISGDLDQIDNVRLDKHNNGLAYAIKLMMDDPLCAVIGFEDAESTRSALARRVAEVTQGSP